MECGWSTQVGVHTHRFTHVTEPMCNNEFKVSMATNISQQVPEQEQNWQDRAMGQIHFTEGLRSSCYRPCG
jgi:hypothetical protein